MRTKSRIVKKSYAMQRMARAIERAVRGASVKERERASRWVAAWGMLCGIRSETVRLRRSEVGAGSVDDRIRQPSDQIEIPGEVASLPTINAGTGEPSAMEAPSQLPLSAGERSAAIAAGIFDPAGRP